jgi:hypothetical protein
VHEGEVDESLEVRQQPPEGRCCTDRSDRSFHAIVSKGRGEVDGEADDHVFVAGESSDESAGLSGATHADVVEKILTSAPQLPLRPGEEQHVS